MVPSPEGAIAGYFSSTVRRIDRRGLLIDIPRLDGEDLAVQSGQTLSMYVQIHGRMYEFESRVRSAELQILLDEPGAAKKTERRSFYRLMLSIPALMTIEPTSRPADDGEDEALEQPEPLTEEVSILDVSGGGVRIRTSAELAIGTQLHLEFATDRRPLRLKAEVIRSTATETGRGGVRHEAHCMFTEIQRGEQDEIVRFIFQKQREFSQRGVA